MNKSAILRMAFEEPLSVGNAREREIMVELFATKDQNEGTGAFVKKRPPVFAVHLSVSLTRRFRSAGHSVRGLSGSAGATYGNLACPLTEVVFAPPRTY